MRSGHGTRCTHGDGRGLPFQCCPDLSPEVAGACIRSALRFKFTFRSVSLFIGSIQALKAPNAKCSQSKTEVLALKGRHFQQARDGMRTPVRNFFVSYYFQETPLFYHIPILWWLSLSCLTATQPFEPFD